MLQLSPTQLIATNDTIESKEYTRYFSWFPLTSADQEIVCYHKKKITIKNRKDVGSGLEVFYCRERLEGLVSDEFFAICEKYGSILIRHDVIDGMQVHIPLTGEFMGKEDMFTDMVQALWEKSYIVVQTIIQTKEFPLIQRSITDPTLVETIVSRLKGVEKGDELSIVESIAPVQRRAKILAEFFAWCEENNHDTTLFEQYDIAVLRCDS